MVREKDRRIIKMKIGFKCVNYAGDTVGFVKNGLLVLTQYPESAQYFQIGKQELKEKTERYNKRLRNLLSSQFRKSAYCKEILENVYLNHYKNYANDRLKIIPFLDIY